MDEFAGKVALITGAGRGIGRDIALALASAGAAVAANDINPLNLDDTIRQVTKAGGIARPYVFDVAKRMPIEGMLTQMMADFERIDILVNHASVHPDASLLEMDEWDFHRTLDVNLAGPFFCMQQVGRMMREQGGGSIVTLISTGGSLSFHKGHAAHSASQAGLLGLTRAAAIELALDHIRVNAICYGVNMVDTVATTELDPAQLQAWQEAHPQIHYGHHPDLVIKLLYLCSREADSFTGHIVTAKIDQ